MSRAPGGDVAGDFGPGPGATTLRVHSLYEFDAASAARLRVLAGGGVLLTEGPVIADAEVCDVLVAGTPSRSHVEACPRLRAVVIPWAGVAPSVRDALAGRPGIAVHNLHHNASATAEHAFALLLAAAKRIVPSDRRMRAHDWKDRGARDPALLLEGRTAAIVGFGAIGRRVGRMCRAFGMHVVGVRRTAPATPDAEGFDVRGAADLDGVLPRADVLVVAVPGTPGTAGLLDARRIGLLPAGAVVVNVGRGAVIDEAALFDALRSGRLHGAGLDVWWRYPRAEDARTPPSSQPFESLDSVVMTPHRAGSAEGIEALRVRALADVLLGLARGGDAPGRVDLARGY